MSKSRSVVYLLLLMTSLFMGNGAFAEESDNEGVRVNTPPMTSEQFKEYRSEKKATNAIKSCKAAMQAFNKKVEDFASACSTAGSLGIITDEDGEKGAISCSQAVKCCLQSDAKGCTGQADKALQADIDRANTFLEELQEQMSSMPEGSGLEQMQDYENQMSAMQNRRTLYAQCPMRGAVGIDKAYEDAEEAREKFEEREEAINEIQQQINEAQAKLEEDKLKIENEMKKLEADTRSDLVLIRDQFDDKIKKLLEAIGAQQTKIREFQRQIAAQEAAKAGAYEGLQQRITELKVGCYEEAVQKAQRSRQKVIEKAANNEYSTDSMETLLKSVGSSTMEDTQKLVEYHRKLCENSYPFKESIKSAQQSYSSQVRTADNSIRIFNEEIALTRIEISKLQSDEKLKAHQDTMEAIEQLQKAYADGMESLQKQYVNTVNTATRQIAQLQQELAQKKAHLQAAQDHLTYKNALLDLQKKATGGDTSISMETWQKISSGYEVLKGLAGEVNSLCPCPEEGQDSGNGLVVNRARNFLSHTGMSPANCAQSYSEIIERDYGHN